VDDQPRICPKCGLPSARLKRLDHYISLFFIPIVSVKRGKEHFLECSRCGEIFEEAARPPSGSFEKTRLRTCTGCGKEVAPDFRFCPYCGEEL